MAPAASSGTRSGASPWFSSCSRSASPTSSRRSTSSTHGSDSKAEQASLAELRTENASLRERIANLDGPDAAERAARKLGMVGPGEGSWVVRGLKP